MSSDFIKGVSDAAFANSAYAAASHEHAEAAKAQCVDAMSLIPYIEIESSQIQESHREMIRLTCHLRTDRFSLEMVRVDVATAWKSTVVGDNVSMHVVTDTQGGFDFKFAILYPNETFITGRITIEPPMSERVRFARLFRASAK